MAKLKVAEDTTFISPLYPNHPVKMRKEGSEWYFRLQNSNGPLGEWNNSYYRDLDSAKRAVETAIANTFIIGEERRKKIESQLIDGLEKVSPEFAVKIKKRVTQIVARQHKIFATSLLVAHDLNEAEKSYVGILLQEHRIRQMTEQLQRIKDAHAEFMTKSDNNKLLIRPAKCQAVAEQVQAMQQEC